MSPETCRQPIASVMVTVMGDVRSGGDDGGKQCQHWWRMVSMMMVMGVGDSHLWQETSGRKVPWAAWPAFLRPNNAEECLAAQKYLSA